MVDFTTFFSAFGAINSIFFAVLLLSLPKKGFKNHWLLGLLFLVLSLRLGKKALYFFIDDPWHGLIFNLMYFSALSLGPLLLLYARQILGAKKTSEWQLLHFLPAAVMLFIAFDWRPTMSEEIWILIYISSLLHLLVYLATIGSKLQSARLQIDSQKVTWLAALSIGFSLVSLSYLAEYFFMIPAYLVTALVYLVVVYGMFSMGMKRQLAKAPAGGKYGNAQLSKSLAEHFTQKLLDLMASEKPHLNPELTMPMLAEKLETTPHLTSQLLNNVIGEGFAEFINKHRIEHALELLRESSVTKISNIATDCGFNSLSAFNVAFKKQTGQSPTEFREEVLSSTKSAV